MLFLFFFFSSRRRHTRSLRDWSSDVCSSDLMPKGVELTLHKDENPVVATVVVPLTLGVLCHSSRHVAPPSVVDQSAMGKHRSEERRVGKECRARGSPEH